MLDQSSQVFGHNEDRGSRGHAIRIEIGRGHIVVRGKWLRRYSASNPKMPHLSCVSTPNPSRRPVKALAGVKPNPARVTALSCVVKAFTPTLQRNSSLPSLAYHGHAGEPARIHELFIVIETVVHARAIEHAHRVAEAFVQKVTVDAETDLPAVRQTIVGEGAFDRQGFGICPSCS